MKNVDTKKMWKLDFFPPSCSWDSDPLPYRKPNPCWPEVKIIVLISFVSSLSWVLLSFAKILNIIIISIITVIQIIIVIIRVLCDAGFDGGLQQTFHMEVAMMMTMMKMMMMMMTMLTNIWKYCDQFPEMIQLAIILLYLVTSLGQQQTVLIFPSQFLGLMKS